MAKVNNNNSIDCLYKETVSTPPKVGRVFKGLSQPFKKNTFRVIFGVPYSSHIIDCDHDAITPDGLVVVEHKRIGNLNFDFQKIDFYLSKKQKTGSIIGSTLREELKNKEVLNANVLDYLLTNQISIPEKWKRDEKGLSRYIFFWGTVYSSINYRYFFIRYLNWCDENQKWISDKLCLTDRWYDGDPALILKDVKSPLV